jgi:hypothetical protein
MMLIVFTNQCVEEGAELVARLREIIPITAAFWADGTDGRDDKLVIASPVVDEQGSLAFYKIVSSLTPNFHTYVYAVSPNDPVASQLASLGNFKSGPFKAYLGGYCPSAVYIEEGADSVTGYAYSLEAPRSTGVFPPVPPSPPRFGKPLPGPLESVTRGKK